MSRASIVAMLIAAEVLIVGLALYTVSGGKRSYAAGMQHVDFTPAAVSPIAAGATPRIVVDDEDSRVTVAVSNDDLVHVRDLTQMHGGVFSSGHYAQLHVTRTSDGVRIERPSGNHLSIEIFGFSRQAIEVLVPRGSQVEVARCSGAEVSGITGDVSVQSQDGRITLADLQGNIAANSADGSVKATNVRGDRLSMETRDGHLTLQDVAAGALVATTRDGGIDARGISLQGQSPQATIHSGDGSVRLQLAPNADLTIDASTGDGRIVVDGSSLPRDDSAQRTIRLGAGTGRMTVGTADGSINISTNGALVQ